MAMIGQKCFDASIGDELSTKSCRVEELRIGLAVSLHSPILDHPSPNREHQMAIISTVS